MRRKETEDRTRNCPGRLERIGERSEASAERHKGERRMDLRSQIALDVMSAYARREVRADQGRTPEMLPPVLFTSRNAPTRPVYLPKCSTRPKCSHPSPEITAGMVVERKPCVRGKMSENAMRRSKATACML
jgi:hypothetical protein